ncbi:hypothetical protein CAPTEDRAFT_199700 [Capitella teleta]|uniref:Apple domain-containing protein n=1 Tax=Capitella teleta TaxID=283909 RepID=R7TC17_CAPTE|nr:hypothetical protein CAPTEDRAFT_199700 [Capitella teleta]|eukprot:ELT91042.1 hypothetical protein CAPTEDRAFT_199700 [Capitella teleta]
MENTAITRVWFLALLACVSHALPDGCSWVNIRGQRLMAWNKERVPAKTLTICQSACENHKGFECRSVDFSRKERACVLSDGDRTDSYLRYYKKWQYSEIQCKDESRNRSACTLVGPVRGKAMYESKLKNTIRSGRTVEKCEAACREEQRFFCISFMFNEVAGMCTLQEIDTKTSRLVEFPTIDYYELNCEPGVDAATWKPPAPVGTPDDMLCSTRGPVVGYSIFPPLESVSHVANLTQCEKLFTEKSLLVRLKAFSYNPTSRECRFHTKNRQTETLVAAEDFNYYESSCEFSEDLVNQCVRFVSEN